MQGSHTVESQASRGEGPGRNEVLSTHLGELALAGSGLDEPAQRERESLSVLPGARCGVDVSSNLF